MHMHAYACLCMHMHAYACSILEMPRYKGHATPGQQPRCLGCTLGGTEVPSSPLPQGTFMEGTAYCARHNVKTRPDWPGPMKKCIELSEHLVLFTQELSKRVRLVILSTMLVSVHHLASPGPTSCIVQKGQNSDGTSLGSAGTVSGIL